MQNETRPAHFRQVAAQTASREVDDGIRKRDDGIRVPINSPEKSRPLLHVDLIHFALSLSLVLSHSLWSSRNFREAGRCFARRCEPDRTLFPGSALARRPEAYYAPVRRGPVKRAGMLRNRDAGAVRCPEIFRISKIDYRRTPPRTAGDERSCNGGDSFPGYFCEVNNLTINRPIILGECCSGALALPRRAGHDLFIFLFSPATFPIRKFLAKNCKFCNSQRESAL